MTDEQTELPSSALVDSKTAEAIAYAWREIETAEKLLADIRKALQDRVMPDIRDAFGRQQRGLELGVPTGPTSQRLFHVDYQLAVPIIEAHIAQQRATIAAMSERTRIALSNFSMGIGR